MFASEGAIVFLSSFVFFSLFVVREVEEVEVVVMGLIRGSSTQLMKCVILNRKLGERNNNNNKYFIPFTSIGGSNNAFG